MASYQEVAVIAANFLSGGNCSDPADAWAKAASEVFPASTSLRDKGCPRAAFLGLCHEGYVDKVEPSSHPRLSKNGEYAVEAVQVLRRNKFLASQPDLLWKQVAGNTKTQNHQMDVVVGLWEAGLLEPHN